MCIYIYWKWSWILNVPNFLFRCNPSLFKKVSRSQKNSAGTAPLGFFLRARFLWCTWVTGCRLHVPPGGSRHQPLVQPWMAANWRKLLYKSLAAIFHEIPGWVPWHPNMGPMVILVSWISWVYRIGRPMGFMHAPRCVGLLPSTVFSLLSVPFSSLSLSEIKSVIRNIIYNQTWWSSFHTHIV